MSLEPLLEYLDNTDPNIACGLTRTKFERRGEKIRIQDSGIISFEMNRHHPVGGTQYTAGSRMAAMVTQRYLYTFNPIDNSITDTVLSEPTWNEEDWDWAGLAEDNLSETSFTFEEIGNSKFEFSEPCSGLQITVTSPEEAIIAFQNKVKDWDFSLSFEDIFSLRPDTKVFLCRRLQHETIKRCTILINEAWLEK